MNRNTKIIAVAGGTAIAYLMFRTRPQITDLAKSVQNEFDIMTTGATRGERNNNPGNIRPASYTWQGQTGVDSGPMGSYIIFSTPEYGIRAIAKDLMTKYARGLDTVREIITAYAPPSENPTESYISSVCQSLGILSTTPLDMNDTTTLTNFVYAIIKHENGRVIYSPSQIADGIAMAQAG